MSIQSILSIQWLASVESMDRWLFTKINHDWTNGTLDKIFPVWREASTWIPLYFLLLFFVVYKFGWKVWPWMVAFLITILLTDQISSHLFKPFFARPRPCHDPLLADKLRLIMNNCSPSFSFTSSHATNHFGMAFFIFFTLRNYLKKWSYFFFFWAATISYGQVYIGIHYPIDVIFGALLGSTIGYITATQYNRRIGLPKVRQVKHSH